MNKAILALVVGLASSILPNANADNANPPVITSVQEISKGPYSIGDVVTLKVNFQGGNPGIKRLGITVPCLNQSLYFGGDLIQDAGSSSFPQPKVDGIISAWVGPCPSNSVMPTKGFIQDKTELITQVTFNVSNAPVFLVNSLPDLLPTKIGEIKPTPLPDSLAINQITLNPIVGTKISLPRLSQGLVPITWTSNNEPYCSISRNFLGDLGGTLTFIKPGPCGIVARSMNVDKFAPPTLISKVSATYFQPERLATLKMTVIAKTSKSKKK